MDEVFRLEAAGGAASVVEAFSDPAQTAQLPTQSRFWKAVARAHELGATGAGQKVAVIDSLCDVDLPALRGKIENVAGGGTAKAHGAAVAILVSLVAPQCTFDIYSITGKSGTEEPGLARKMIEQAALSDASVLNMSFGAEREFVRHANIGDQPGLDVLLDNPHRWLAALSPDAPGCALCEAASRAGASGKLAFAAAGNDPRIVSCPARAENVIGVGFQQPSRAVVALDNGGQLENAAARGVDGQSATFDIAVEAMSGVNGTSFASPLYSGIGALGVQLGELNRYLASTRVGELAATFHSLLRSGRGSSDMVETTDMLYQRAVALLPHVHAPMQARLNAGETMTDASSCWKCGVFAEDKYVNAGLFFLEIGRVDEGMGMLLAARAFAPWSFDAAANLGRGYKLLGRRSDAIACYDEAIRLRPNFAPYLAERATL